MLTGESHHTNRSFSFTHSTLHNTLKFSRFGVRYVRSIHSLTLTYKASEAAFQEVVLTLCQRLRTFRRAYPVPFLKDGLGEGISILLRWLLAHGPVERQARLEMG